MDPKTKIPTTSKLEIIDWVAAAWRALQEQEDLIMKAFLVTGISGTKEQVRNDAILKLAKAAAGEKLQELFQGYLCDNSDDDQDPFADLDEEDRNIVP